MIPTRASKGTVVEHDDDFRERVLEVIANVVATAMMNEDERKDGKKLQPISREEVASWTETVRTLSNQVQACIRFE